MSEITISVGSASSRKIRVVELVLAEYFPDDQLMVEGINVASGQPETPWDKQTYDGAVNRAQGAMRDKPADFAIGLESGLIERYDGKVYEEAWAVVQPRNGEARDGYSSGLMVPTYIIDRMKASDLEHSDLMTIIEEEFDLPNSDTWGSYSAGLIVREQSLIEALRNAMIQIVATKSFYHLKYDPT